MKLSEYISIKRRYNRSINLERDILTAHSLEGYVVTPRIKNTFDRIEGGLSDKRTAAFTLTGVYGSGKSAFAALLGAAFSKEDKALNRKAKKLLAIDRDLGDYRVIVTTAQRESISRTLARGLGLQAPVDEDLSQFVLDHCRKIIKETGLVLIIDEMGKNIEYSVSYGDFSDLYLLQQLAELDVQGPFLLIGLLHQAMNAYVDSFASKEKTEWLKIQGRFEDIIFQERPEETVQIIASAIEKKKSNKKEVRNFYNQLEEHAELWAKALRQNSTLAVFDAALINKFYPLHPVTAYILPILASRYAQNERTLFSFLSSYETASLNSFLDLYSFSSEEIPFLKPHFLYDYFFESSGIAMRGAFSKWMEVEQKVQEVRPYGKDIEIAIKTIGILNLVASGGELRASKELTLKSLLTHPNDKQERVYWEEVLQELVSKKWVLYRSLSDEYRIWQGSDYDIDKAVREYNAFSSSSLEEILKQYISLPPVIARRHSYTTGTLRYFFRSFYSFRREVFFNPRTTDPDADGYIIISFDKTGKDSRRSLVSDDSKPVIYLEINNSKKLKELTHEYAALQYLKHYDRELAADGVAQKEVKRRIHITYEMLQEEMELLLTDYANMTIALNGVTYQRKIANLNQFLSSVLDDTYSKTPIIWNELINRKHISSQAAKARKDLMFYVLNNYGKENFLIEGNGPEATIMHSLYLRTGLYSYSKKHNQYTFKDPRQKNSNLSATSKNNVNTIFADLLDIFESARNDKMSLADMANILTNPPYGAKEGIVPLLFLAALYVLGDRISIYERDTFLPELKEHHIEMLLKKPEYYRVKYYEIYDIHARYFQNLSTIFGSKKRENLVSVITPFIKFYNNLPYYSKVTKNISERALSLRGALADAKEPEDFLFNDMPESLGFPPIGNKISNQEIVELKKVVHETLLEIKEASDKLLERIQLAFNEAFSLATEAEISQLKEQLQAWARQMNSERIINPSLRAFVKAILEEQDAVAWLKRLALVVADKPVDHWWDEDIEIFEVKLADLAKSFIRYQFLLSKNKVDQIPNNFESFLVSLTQHDGQEYKDILAYETDESLEKYVSQLYSKLDAEVGKSTPAKKLLFRRLAEELLSTEVDMEDQKTNDFINHKNETHYTDLGAAE